MDNASKAITLAGSILIATLIISFGVYLFNRGVGVVEWFTAIIDERTFSIINSKFNPYLGTSVDGNSVKRLIDVIKAHNISHEGVTIIIKARSDFGSSFNPQKSRGTYKTSDDFDQLKREVVTGSAKYNVEVTNKVGYAYSEITITGK